MPSFAVIGDMNPYLIINIHEPELKEIATKLAIGIPPETINLKGKLIDGSRVLDVQNYIGIRGKSYSVRVKQNTPYLHYEPNADAEEIPF